MIPHGALDYLTRLPDERPLPPDLARVDGPVVLCFGLIRPHKGVDVLLEAFRSVAGAELWIVGMPRVPSTRCASSAGSRTACVSSRASFPTRRSRPTSAARSSSSYPTSRREQSGVLNIALAFGKPLVLGRGRLPGGRRARRRREARPAARSGRAGRRDQRAARRRRGAAASRRRRGEGGRRSLPWDEIAARTIDLYRSLNS